MKKIFACLMVLGLVGCVSAPMDQAASYQKLSWANKSFDRTLAECRHSSMRQTQHSSKYKKVRYDVIDSVLTACMERYGYRYNPDGAPNVQSDSVEAPKDKSALYR